MTAWVLGFARRRAPILASVLVAGVWAALAVANPTLTYHFAPAVVAAAWPYTSRWVLGRGLTPALSGRAALGGFVVASATAAELRALDALRGPDLFGGSAAVAESVAAAAAGALAGFLLGLRTVRA